MFVGATKGDASHHFQKPEWRKTIDCEFGLFTSVSIHGHWVGHFLSLCSLTHVRARDGFFGLEQFQCLRFVQKHACALE